MFSSLSRLFRRPKAFAPAAMPASHPSAAPAQRRVRFSADTYFAPPTGLPSFRSAAPTLMQVMSHGSNLSVAGLWPELSKMPAGHVTAVMAALHGGHDALVRQGNRSGWRNTHLVHATYTPGTPQSAWTQRVAARSLGVQLGAAHAVRGRNGHLHVYAMVYGG